MATDSELSALQQRLEYKFVNKELLKQSLTHRSAAKVHNQRLEFLGDAVLGLLVADALYEQFPEAPEGELSQRRAKLVNRDALATFARALNLGDLLILGAGERKSGGRQRDSILCDAVEALLGSVYLDGGLDATRPIVERLMSAALHSGVEQAKDAKTRLQELLQSAGEPLPDYRVTSVEGQEHDQLFRIECHISLLSEVTRGEGRSRKLAEQEAAAEALKLLGPTVTGGSAKGKNGMPGRNGRGSPTDSE